MTFVISEEIKCDSSQYLFNYSRRSRKYKKLLDTPPLTLLRLILLTWDCKKESTFPRDYIMCVLIAFTVTLLWFFRVQITFLPYTLSWIMTNLISLPFIPLPSTLPLPSLAQLECAFFPLLFATTLSHSLIFAVAATWPWILQELYWFLKLASTGMWLCENNIFLGL